MNHEHKNSLLPKKRKVNCKHKYVDMEDGTRDKFCVRCGTRFMQAAMYIQPSITININGANGNIQNEIEEDIQRKIMNQLNKELRRGGAIL